jgi:hypothetical protein
MVLMAFLSQNKWKHALHAFQAVMMIVSMIFFGAVVMLGFHGWTFPVSFYFAGEKSS